MARIAPRIHTEAAEIARLEALAMRLGESECVALTLDDGGILRGVVAAVPSIQTFFDAAGNEGLNAMLRLEPLPAGAGVGGQPLAMPATEPDAGGLLWLDRIRRVERLPNPSPPEPSTRTHPPDPNAPA